VTIRAAGILILDKDGKALFVRRGPGGDSPGMWCVPGGRLEDDETALEAAVRETEEEAGYKADPEKLVLWTRRVAPRETTGPVPAPVKPGDQVEPPLDSDDVDFTTFLLRGVDPFLPVLGPKEAPEHVAYAWCEVGEPPEPLHPGCRIALARFGMDELGIARAIASGELTSPQKYQNVWLFAIRITGTGAAFRNEARDPKTKKVLRESEWVWRDPSLYLNDEFLARCNGLQVVWEHPKSKVLTSEEFNDRTIGAVMLPFIGDGAHFPADEVWGVAKIYDEAAATLMESNKLSTSPGVGDTGLSKETRLQDGRKLLIEDKPSLFDHVAVCELGVWDKGGPAAGVSSAEVDMADEKNTAEERIDAAAVMKALDKVTEKLDSAHARLDSMERKDAEKAEKEREEEEERKDRARHDAARKDKFAHRKDGESEEEYKARHDADEAAMCDALEKGGVAKDKARKDAHKARHDAEEGEKKEHEEKERHDAKARKDADELKRAEKEEEEKEERARHDSALATENADLKAKLADLEGKVDGLTREIPAEERNAIAVAQARADSVAAMFGERASAPITGETSLAYRRRLLKSMQKRSTKFKEARVDSLDSETLGMIENVVYGEAAEAARRTDSADKPGILVPYYETDEAGRRITKFHGDPMAWMQHFMGGSYPCGKVVRNPNAAN
jgi:8-oxo-dGTP pyrophosphatase MutT (NUDIX family)